MWINLALYLLLDVMEGCDVSHVKSWSHMCPVKQLQLWKKVLLPEDLIKLNFNDCSVHCCPRNKMAHIHLFDGHFPLYLTIVW